MSAAHAATPREVERFREALPGVVGLSFRDDKLPLLAETLGARMRALGIRRADQYLDGALRSPAEQCELARALTVTESYFLRDRNQFRAFADIIERRAASGRRSLRLLSAACSSGDEAGSIGIVVRETLPDFDAWDVSILAVDLNEDALARARRGEYGTWSLRETPEDVRARYFHEHGGRFTLDGSIQKMVQFERRNLMDPDRDFWRAERFDVVFCRNVLMYFSPAAMRSVVERIAGALAPDGYLFLGHAENLRGISNEFVLEHSHDTFYYRRGRASERAPASAPPRDAVPAVAAPEPAVTEPADRWFEAIARASERVSHLATPATSRPASAPSTGSVATGPARDLGPTLELLRQERFKEALALLSPGPVGRSEGSPRGAAEGSSSRPLDAEALLLRAVLLLGDDDVAAAERACEELLARDDLNAGAHFVMALCREHAHDTAGAREHGEAAAYLDASFAMPHLHLGLLARRSGDTVAARRELRLATELLEREDSARILLFGGGFGREALLELCRTQARACEDPGE